MPEVRVRTLTLESRTLPETSKARTILKHAHEAVEGFIDSFSAVRRDRGAGQGATRDEEQDLLRAAVVFAAAGLDSVLKQLIRDSIAPLARDDEAVIDGLQRFVRKQLKGDIAIGEGVQTQTFLARILIAESHRDELIELYILDLTGSSLQSADEVMKAAGALGLEPRDLGVNKPTLKPIFDIRNKIIHELDINLAAPTRNRESRKRATMVRHANALLEIGEKFVDGVETKLLGE
jgi:hypothetical protein